MKKIICTLFLLYSVNLYAQDFKTFNKKFFSFEVPSNWRTPDPDEKEPMPHVHIPMGAVDCEVSVIASAINSITDLASNFSMPVLKIKDTLKTSELEFECYEEGTNKYWLHEDIRFNLIVFSQDCSDDVPVLDLLKSIRAKKPKTVWKSYKSPETGLILYMPKHWNHYEMETNDHSTEIEIIPYEDVTVNIIKYPDAVDTKKAFDKIDAQTEHFKTDHFNFLVKQNDKEDSKYYFTQWEDQAFILRIYPYASYYFCRYNVLNDFIKKLKPAN